MLLKLSHINHTGLILMCHDGHCLVSLLQVESVNLYARIVSVLTLLRHASQELKALIMLIAAAANILFLYHTLTPVLQEAILEVCLIVEHILFLTDSSLCSFEKFSIN